MFIVIFEDPFNAAVLLQSLSFFRNRFYILLKDVIHIRMNIGAEYLPRRPMA